MTPQNQTGLRAFDAVYRYFDRATSLMSVVGTVAILFIMCLITADVVGRFFFGHPIPGVPEIVSMLILSIVFLQIANTLLLGRLTRADGLLMLLRSRAPKVAGLLDVFMHLVGFGLTAVLAYAFYPLFLRSFGRNEMVGTVGHFLAPIWPTYLIVLIGAAALCLAFALRAVAILIVTFRNTSAAEVAR